MGTHILESSVKGIRKSELQLSDLYSLVSSVDYRTFVKTYLKMRNLNFSDFSRAANCTRAFTNQVLSNKRRLTAKSVYTFEQAFKLPLNAKKIFRLLVAKEEVDLFPEMDRSNLDDQIKKLQTNVLSKPRKDYNDPDYTQMDKTLEVTHQTVSIFAACGDCNAGASLEQLYQRTRLAENVLNKNIDLLLRMNLLEKKGDLYFPINMHIFMQTKTRIELLDIIFKTAMNAASSRFTQVADGSSELFFASQFCINESQLPALKKELTETILKFVDDSTENNGDRVLKLVTALHL